MTRLAGVGDDRNADLKSHFESQWGFSLKVFRALTGVSAGQGPNVGSGDRI